MKKIIFYTTLFTLIMTFCACGDDDYLNEMMLTNYTIYDWHNACIHFMNSDNKVKKKKDIGTLERYNHTYVQREADYFVVEFTDDLGAVHKTEKYLSASTVSVGSIAK